MQSSSPTDLLHPFPTPHFETFQVFLIYCPNHPTLPITICKLISLITTNFLDCLLINDTLSWKTHIEYIIPNLSTACYAIRIMKPYKSQNILRMIYFSYFYSVMNYSLLFWGNSSYSMKNL